MKTFLPTAVCALALFSGGAMAQAVQPAPKATTATVPSDMYLTPSASDYSASELIGTKVTNRANETIGEIADVMLDSSQKVRAVMVSVGGFLGVGSRYVAVKPAPLDIIKKSEKSYAVTMDATKDTLKAAPEFKYTRKSS